MGHAPASEVLPGGQHPLDVPALVVGFAVSGLIATIRSPLGSAIVAQSADCSCSTIPSS
jgi:hypothetical protein